MTDSVPEKLGKYRIIEEVGRGGFAAVYKGLDTTLKRTVALKVLAPHLLWDPTFVQRFQREAEVAANLDHPNIVTIYEVSQIEGVYFIAMQFLEGRTLSQILEAEGPLPVSRVRAIIKQIASALDYAHARGFVHRDIKPSNIIVADDGRATLTDFGLVKAGEGTKLSTTGVIFGTPEYMSPEQAEGKKLDARSDVYSLGVVLFEMLAGRAPFVADTTPAVMYKHVHEPPPLGELPSDLPQGVVALVEKALAKDPAVRFQTMAGIVEALEKALEEVKAEERKPQREKLAVLYAEAVGFLKAKEWQKALDKWAEVQAIDPHYPDPKKVAATAKSELERLAEEKRRQEKLAALYTDAVGFLKAKEWQKALDKWAEVQAIDPHYPDPKKVAAIARKEITRRKEKKRWREKLAVLCAEAAGFLKTAEWRKALDKWAEVPIWRRMPGRVWALGALGVLTIIVIASFIWRLTQGGTFLFTSDLFTSDRDGKREIYRLTGVGEVERVTSTPGGGESWSPASEPGGAILFTSDRDGKREIYRLTGTGEVERVTSTPGDGESWSPASEPGGAILFTSDRDGKREIYRLAGAGEVERVTSTPGDGESWLPAW